jgi:hypothetical protein
MCFQPLNKLSLLGAAFYRFVLKGIGFSVFPFLVAMFLLLGCSGRKNQSDSIARVGDKYLSYEQVSEEMPMGLYGKDSIDFVMNYAEAWVKQQILLRKAERNVNPDELDIDRMLETYRTSLITFAYEKALVQQNLDTLVSDEEIEDYYRKNQNDFELKDNIIKVVYVKVKKNAPKLPRLKELYKSERPQDRMALEDYCHQFADNFFLNDNIWLLFDDLLKEIPIETYDQEKYLKNNRFVEFEDQDFLYLVNIKGFRIRDSISPLSFERDNIRNIIINKRKLTIIEQMRKQVYDEALRKNDFEIYFKGTL